MTQGDADKEFPPRALSDEALGWIVRLNSGEAAKGDTEAFAHWRARSPAHEAAAAEAEQLWLDATDLHHDAATGRIRPGRGRKGPSRRSVLTGIAGAGVATGAGLWASGAMRGLMADHVTGLAETRRVDLPDGSRVHLNAMSALDLDFTRKRRRVVLLEGQAYFETVLDPGRAFHVDIANARIAAGATAFDVNLNLADERAAITVTDNAVRVARRGGGETQPGVDVAAGESVIVAQDGRTGAATAQDVSVTLAWRDGVFIAEEQALEDVAAALRPYLGGWIVIPEAQVRSLRVNAVLDLSRPEHALDTLAAGLPVAMRGVAGYLCVISST